MTLPATVPPQLDDVARLLADPARLRMLWALGDGRAHTAGELAAVAALSASAASNHLVRLVDAGVLEVRRQGRHRYYALTREDIGRAVEAMAAVALAVPPAAPALPQVRPALRHARRCYGHLAGGCGVALWDALVDARLLVAGADGRWQRDADAWSALASATGSAPLRDAADGDDDVVAPCLDWTERRWHLGGAFGRRVLAGLRTAGILADSPAGDRTLLVDPVRWQALLHALGAAGDGRGITGRRDTEDATSRQR